MSEYFHINRALPYSSHGLMELGKRYRFGDEESPFFAFYRKYRRTYPLTLNDGNIVHVPAIQFLKLVKGGQINPGNLAGDALEIAQHFAMLARELLWESVRLSEFPSLPSRQRACWLIKDERGIAQWRDRLKDKYATQILRVSASGISHDCDAAWLLGDSEALDETYSNARSYWSGSLREQHSEPETLFVGELEVIEVIQNGGQGEVISTD